MRRWGLLPAGMVLIFLALWWILAISPAQAVRRCFQATYAQQLRYRDLSVKTITFGWKRSLVRVVVRFEKDPDYGAAGGAPAWQAFYNDVEMKRHGFRWKPTRGGFLTGNRTYGVFPGHWVAVDPEVERSRAYSSACQCADLSGMTAAP